MKIQKKNNMYHIKGTPYKFNNKYDAEHLLETMTKYEKMNKHIIQMQMSLKIMEAELNTLKEMINNGFNC